MPKPFPQGGGEKLFKIIQGLSKFLKLHKFLIAERIVKLNFSKFFCKI